MDFIEIGFLAVWLVFGVVGWVRGFYKELGVTLILTGALIICFFLETKVGPVIQSYTGTFYPQIAVLLYSGVIIFAALIAYQGQTIIYPGKDPTGFLGSLWSIGIGLFNGYLIVGTIWYYLNKYGYPFGNFVPPLSGTAQSIIAILPFNFLPTQYTMFILIGGLLFLLLLRVIR